MGQKAHSFSLPRTRCQPKPDDYSRGLFLCQINSFAVVSHPVEVVAFATRLITVRGGVEAFLMMHLVLGRQQLQQFLHILLFQITTLPALESRRQVHRAIAHAHQAADDQADRFEHAPDFAIAAFGQDHVVPVVGPLPAPFGDQAEAGQAVLELNAGAQTLEHFRSRLAEHAHRVFALDFVARMHHAIGEVAVVGKQQEAAGIEIEAADGDPAPALQPRQFCEHAGAPVGVVAGDYFAFRFVIDQHSRQAQLELELHQLAIDADLVFGTDALADVGRQAIDADAAGDDPFLEFAARTEAGIGQGLVQLGRVDEDGFVAAPGVGRQRGAAADAGRFGLRARRTLRRTEGASLARRSVLRALARRPR